MNSSNRCPPGPPAIVVPLLGDLALGENEDAIRVAERRQPVGHEDRRSFRAGIDDGLLYLPFAEIVEGRGPFIENQNRRVLEEHLGNRDALPLPPESCCKTLTQRLKGSDMKWDADNAEAVTALESLCESGVWKPYWEAQMPAMT